MGNRNDAPDQSRLKDEVRLPLTSAVWCGMKDKKVT